MGGAATKETAERDQNIVNDISSGTHLVEIHANSMGLGFVSIVIIVITVLLFICGFYACMRQCKKLTSRSGGRTNGHPGQGQQDFFQLPQQQQWQQMQASAWQSQLLNCQRPPMPQCNCMPQWTQAQACVQPPPPPRSRQVLTGTSQASLRRELLEINREALAYAITSFQPRAPVPNPRFEDVVEATRIPTMNDAPCTGSPVAREPRLTDPPACLGPIT